MIKFNIKVLMVCLILMSISASLSYSQTNPASKTNQIDFTKIKVLKLKQIMVMMDNTRKNQPEILARFILEVHNDTLIAFRNPNVEDQHNYLLLSLVNLEKIILENAGLGFENCKYDKMVILCDHGGFTSENIENIIVNLTKKSHANISGAKSVKFSATDICTVKIESVNTEISGSICDEAELTIKGKYNNKGIAQKGNPIISELKD